MSVFNTIARDLVALHDTNVDPDLIDSLVSMAVRLSYENNDQLAEDFFTLVQWVYDDLTPQLRQTIENAEISSFATI